MLKSIILQRIIVILDAVMLGFIVDRTSDSPLWGMLALILAGSLGLFLLSNTVLQKTRENLNAGFDSEIVAILRSTSLALIFFIECAVAAWLIVA